jgi:acyl-CoA reductase-like NAD-dependent aldehyde dehydrogenase
MDQTAGLQAIGLKHPDKFFIGGKWCKPSTQKRLTLVNPATEGAIMRIAEAGEADIDASVAAARSAFDEGPWPRMSHAERAVYMTRMVEALKDRVPDLAHAWTQQVGVTFASAKANSRAAIAVFAYYAGLAESFRWEEERPTYFRGQKGLIVREPVGVVAAIVPWNAPFFTLANKAAPALIAGCTLIMKPSPETPIEAYILAEAAEAAGLPPGVINLVTAHRGVSEHLVRSPAVDKVSFTGSSAAGKRIASICGERIARFTLELGGKSAAILLDDYDIHQAAHDLATSGCQLSGQVCSNLTRFLVPASSHDRFVEALAAQLRAVRVGDPYDPETQMGPLAMERQLHRIREYIETGKKDGAELVCGGGHPAHLSTGYFLEPTLFAHVDNRSTIAQEEIFGPVFCVTPYRGVEDAIRLANDSPFGLNGAVFTNDSDQAYRVARAVRTGTLGQNGSRTDFSIAFGGFKESGCGREGGTEGVLPYIETKTVVLDRLPAHVTT